MNNITANTAPARHLCFDLTNARIQLGHALKERGFFGAQCLCGHDLGPVDVDFWLPEVRVAIKLIEPHDPGRNTAILNEWLKAWLARRNIQLLCFDTLEILESRSGTLQSICRLIEARFKSTICKNRLKRGSPNPERLSAMSSTPAVS